MPTDGMWLKMQEAQSNKDVCIECALTGNDVHSDYIVHTNMHIERVHCEILCYYLQNSILSTGIEYTESVYWI